MRRFARSPPEEWLKEFGFIHKTVATLFYFCRMQEQHERFYSNHISRDFQLQRFGWSGRPMIVFPTTLGRYHEAKDMGLIGSIAPLIEAGRVIVYCVDTLNHESWYNKQLHPRDMVRTQAAYDRMIRHELVPMLQSRHHAGKVIAAGCSFGAYSAANFAFKYPEVVSDLIGMSGSYDIKSFLKGYYDDEVYFNNPIDFMNNPSNPELYKMGIILGTSEWDICRPETVRMSNLLNEKGINHWLDMRGWVEHDWPLWNDMFPHYLGRVLG